MTFISVPFTIDSSSLADAAIQRLIAAWPGWEPNDGDLEVIQIEALAPMASDAAQVASSVPDAIFRQYGLTLYGLSYETGTPAKGTATIYASDNLGYTSEGVIQFALGGIAFTTDDVVHILGGATSTTAPITALVNGEVGNDLTGSGNQLTSYPWVSSILVSPPTSFGSDPESDSGYQDRLRDRLRLQGTTLVTGYDFEQMALTVPGVERAVALVGNARQVTVAVTDDDGEPVPPAVKTEIQNLYADYRQVNTLYIVIDATYTSVNVGFTIVALPEYDPDDVVARATESLQLWLDPLNWGKPVGTSSESGEVWLNSTKVRVTEATRVISVPGVRYVKTTTVNSGTTDVTLSGTVPLTRVGTITGAWATS